MKRAKTNQDEGAIFASDFLQLTRADAPSGGLSGWLAAQVREAIADGRLPAGSKLPASRLLAADLGVSRGVITEAYRRLAEDGQVAGRRRGGTSVLAAPAAVPGLAAPDGVQLNPADHTRGSAEAQPARSVPVPFRATPDASAFRAVRGAECRIDLSPGVPDLAAFPRSAWLRAERAVLSDVAPASLGYGDPRGALPFRETVASWLARNRGIRARPEDIIVVAGVAQSLALLARVLNAAGHNAIAVEDPCSLGARQQLQSWGLDTPPASVDEAGLRVDELRATGAGVVMLTPAHQFPMGVVLDGRRRRELWRWMQDGGLVIEDDYDAEHRYDRPPVPALHSVLPEQVFYCGSVSKLLAPALRTGWLLVPAAYRDAITAAKFNADLGSAVLPQLVLARLMSSGELERHQRLLRRRHIRRRDAMLAAITTHLPEARIHGAAAGLHLTLTFDGHAGRPEGASPSGHDWDVRLAAAALHRGVKTQPLSWHRQVCGPPGLVLGYATSTPAQIDDGIAVLGSVAREVT